MTELLHKELTRRIIGVYYDVYNGLSHTYPEYIYQNAMMQDLAHRGIQCKQQAEYQVRYKDKLVGLQIMDIFVAGEVVVELKVKPKLSNLDQAQTISYMKTAGKHVGLLFNFGGSEPEFRRVYFDKKEHNRHCLGNLREELPDILFPEVSYEVIGGLFEVHNELGPGFIHRIYANACYWEMRSRGLACKPSKQLTVFYCGRPVGEINLGHLILENSIILFPIAIRDTSQIRLENLRNWMACQGISLGILANFHSEKLQPEFMREINKP